MATNEHEDYPISLAVRFDAPAIGIFFEKDGVDALVLAGAWRDFAWDEDIDEPNQVRHGQRLT